jgi:diacylglycerol O-acyltransferase-1
MFPIARDSVEPIRNKDYLKILGQTLHMSVPASYLWLLIFYSVFHSYMNFWGELTQFADRRFYYDWWNAGDLSEYWRKWNFPIHSFLMRHIYYPLRRRQVNKALALFITFFTSAVGHEYLMIGIIRDINFIAFTIMIVNVPLMIL